MNTKLTELTQWLQTSGLDAALITAPDNVFYLSGFLSDPHEDCLH